MKSTIFENILNPKRKVFFEYPTITEMLNRSSLGRDGQTLFLEEKRNGLQISFGRWRQDLLETAERFRRHPAKHIGVVCDLSYECILCMYGVIVAGKVLVPLEADRDAETLDGYVQRADVELLLYHDGMIEGKITRCETIAIPEFLRIPAQAPREWPQWEGERNACIFFTSGTEGEPLGAVLTQKNLSYIISQDGYRKMNRSPRILIFLPLHHVLSFFTLNASIHDGCEIHLSRSIKYLSLEMQKIRPDVITSVPMVNELYRGSVAQVISAGGMKQKIDRLIRLSNALRKIGVDLRTPLFQGLRSRLGGLPQLILTGGSASSEDTIRFFDNIGIIVLQAYGSTETSATVSSNRLEWNRIGSVGRPLWFNEVRIRDSEIQVRGGNIMKEYYKNPQATRNAFDGDWFKTGDLGRFDADGYLYVTGRKKNLIILDSGENVSPEELEKQLLRSPWIGEALVCERDGHIHAQIVADPRSAPEPEAVENAVREAVDALNRRNPVYKRIASWELKKEPFEKTSTLKIRR